MSEPVSPFEKGNVDLANRPVVRNADGTTSTVRSMSFEEDGAEILVPTVSPDGKILSDDDAITLYRSTGQHLGKFKTPDDASAYAQTLHEDQAKLYGDKPKPDPWRGRNLIDPAMLPKSVATGPESWGEAVTSLASSRDAADSIIENSMSDRDLLEEIYNRRIEKIESLTGERLENPIFSRAFGVVPVPGFLQPSSREAYRSQEQDFDQRLQGMSEKFPQLGSAFQETVAAEKTRLMRDADEKAKTAASSPALGMGGRLVGEMLGGLRAAARDPLQWQMAITSGGGSTAKTVAGRVGQTIVQEALLNGGQELLLQAASQERKRSAGLDHGLDDMLKNAGVAATFGALFGGSLQGGAELARIFKLGDGGAERATRVLEGRPEPGDVETVAKAMGVELGPERMDLINRSFEERVLDDVMVPADATPERLQLLDAAQRYAEDPDNNPPPDLVERLLADPEGARTRFSADDYERMFAGNPNAIDDIGDTFFARDVEASAARIDGAAGEPPAASDGGAITFQTEKGSTYIVNGQSTSRNKAARDLPGHEGDFGEKPASALTIYVDSNAGALSAAGLNGVNSRGARVALKDGRAALVTWNEKAGGWGASSGSRDIPYHLEPAVGRYPLELWNPAEDVPGYQGFAKMHAGNKIVALAESRPDASVRPAYAERGAPDRQDGSDVVTDGVVGGDQRASPNVRPSPDPIEGQTIRPAEPKEALVDPAMVQAERDAGEIIEPLRDANGNPENFLDFIGVEDGDGSVRVMSTMEALAMADEPERLAAVLESCRL